jgi:hypothetical protein
MNTCSVELSVSKAISPGLPHTGLRTPRPHLVQVQFSGKLNSSKALGSAASAARAADLMLYCRSLSQQGGGAAGGGVKTNTVTNTVLDEEVKRLMEKMPSEEVGV